MITICKSDAADPHELFRSLVLIVFPAVLVFVLLALVLLLVLVALVPVPVLIALVPRRLLVFLSLRYFFTGSYSSCSHRLPRLILLLFMLSSWPFFCIPSSQLFSSSVLAAVSVFSNRVFFFFFSFFLSFFPSPCCSVYFLSSHQNVKRYFASVPKHFSLKRQQHGNPSRIAAMSATVESLKMFVMRRIT